MLITDKEKLQQYTTEHRVWQGIPSIEVTKKGRLFATFYSGGIKEDIGNFVILVKSDDGDTFSEPILVAHKEDYRCFDPCVWMDPLGRLWLTWSMIPDHGTYATICDDPDAEELSFGEVFFVGHDVMMNKPTVLSTGEWLFPIAVWNDGVRVLTKEYDSKEKDKKSFVYKTVDNGRTFEKLGGADVKERSYDEHMVLELADGRLAMYVRTYYGIGVSYSFDRGKTWTDGRDSGLGGPSSRFFIRRLPSGRILLIGHDDTKERNNLTAYLSEDEGKTWPYKILLDERMKVAYPDATVDEDGYIHITYDRERGDSLKSLDEAYSKAREILYARITEDDIIAGRPHSEKSMLKGIISKLGKYSEEKENPFHEFERFTDAELAEHLLQSHPEHLVEKIFGYYPINCVNMHQLEATRFDELVEALDRDRGDKLKIVTELVTIVRSVSEFKIDKFPVVETVKQIIMANKDKDLSVTEIAEKAGISKHYMMHLFKKVTGTTLTEYKNALKIACAKKLLISSSKSMAAISQECGFGSSSYFSKVFLQSEKISPSEYRRLLQK
ncbi:MAG: helix-turn-helix domain-containing protein [Ruminococcaceae bacterium]|nr:helix-turn-helix domain-containing protein [Oscillospiraceae bacterium]